VSKWADYCITAVSFNTKHSHIEEVRRRVDNGDTLGTGSDVSRETVVADIKRGVTYVTVFKDDKGDWRKGQAVFIVTINGEEYIKTVEDRTTKDNLDNLPEF